MDTPLRSRVRRFLVAVALLPLATVPWPAEAGLRARCRKLCKPAVVACVATTGQSRGACKKPILRQCRLEGLEVCEAAGGTTSTTTPSSPRPTTTTLPPAPGILDLDVEDITRDGSTDPGLYGFLVKVAGDPDTVPVSLVPSAFHVLDTQENRYEANPATAAGDCSVDDVVGPGGTVTCWIHFTLPLVVGFDAEAGGEGYGKLFVEVGGYRRAVSFRVHASGGWGTIG